MYIEVHESFKKNCLLSKIYIDLLQEFQPRRIISVTSPLSVRVWDSHNIQSAIKKKVHNQLTEQLIIILAQQMLRLLSEFLPFFFVPLLGELLKNNSSKALMSN